MERARQWVRGWVLCREAPDPVEEPDGFRIDMGRHGHRVRFVLTGLETVGERASALTAPGTWLKVCAPRAEVLPLLGPQWSVGEPEFLMSTALDRPAEVGAPTGYRVDDVHERGWRLVVVTGVDGAEAAHGRFAVRDGAAVVDQVETAPEHRRRGLGKVVMSRIAVLAARAGADTAVLVSSVAGRPLYESLGWRVESDVVAAHLPER